MFVCEDDKSLRSSFFLDLGGLVDANNTIPINIVYHSKNFYDSQSININRNTYTSTKIDRMKINYKNIKTGIEKLYADCYVPEKKTFYITADTPIGYLKTRNTTLKPKCLRISEVLNYSYSILVILHTLIYYQLSLEKRNMLWRAARHRRILGF